MSKKQSTVFRFGFHKNVEHRGNVVDLLDDSSYVENIRRIYLSKYSKRFKTKAGLSMHEAWCKISKMESPNAIQDNVLVVIWMIKEVKSVLDNAC